MFLDFGRKKPTQYLQEILKYYFQRSQVKNDAFIKRTYRMTLPTSLASLFYFIVFFFFLIFDDLSDISSAISFN